MHQSAMKYGKAFFEVYCSNDFQGKTIVDVGSQDVNGSLREHCPEGANYVGVDFVEGKGVDVVLTDPYQLPFGDASVDVVVCSSVFEHSEFFWLLFLECVRIVKLDGLIYLNAPSNGHVHRYPIDSWRFYPDAGRALVNWSRRNSYNTLLLESFIGEKEGAISGDGMWNDFVSVILKDQVYESLHPNRIFQEGGTAFCGYSSDRRNDFPMVVKNPDLSLIAEQQDRIVSLSEVVSERGKELEELSKRYISASALVEERGKELEELSKRYISASALVEERGKEIESYACRADELSVQLKEKRAEIARLNGSILNIVKRIFR